MKAKPPVSCKQFLPPPHATGRASLVFYNLALEIWTTIARLTNPHNQVSTAKAFRNSSSPCPVPKSQSKSHQLHFPLAWHRGNPFHPINAPCQFCLLLTFAFSDPTVPNTTKYNYPLSKYPFILKVWQNICFFQEIPGFYFLRCNQYGLA